MARATTQGAPPASGRRRTPRKGDVKEAAILETAWRLLSEKPVASISVEDLASGAGIHRSSFYFYFDSRDAVIRALAVRTIEDLQRAMLTGVDPSQPGRELVRQIITGLLARWRDQGAMLRAMAAMCDEDPELMVFWDHVNDEINTRFAEAIDDARRAGAALPGPPASVDLVRAMSAMIWRSGYEMSLRPPSPKGFNRLVDTLTEVTIRSIYGT
jgi:AcrR family transcriptional regulator